MDEYKEIEGKKFKKVNIKTIEISDTDKSNISINIELEDEKIQTKNK